MTSALRSPLLRAALATAGLAAIAAAAMTGKSGFLALGVLLLLPVATSLGQAGRLAASLRGFERRPVRAIVWGAPLPSAATTAVALQVDSIGAVGAGLLIYLSDSARSRTLLKVAQPRAWRVEDGRLVIGEAAYVQWAGKRLARSDGVAAVVLAVVAPEAAGGAALSR